MAISITTPFGPYGRQDLDECEGSIEVDGETVYCDQPATEKVQGEHDSFGTEWIHFCDSCAREWYERVWDERNREFERAKTLPCSRCKSQDGTVQPYHIWDEPSYEDDVLWCRKCREWDRHTLDEELCWYDRRDDERAGKDATCWCGDREHKAEDEARDEQRAIYAKQEAECAEKGGVCWCGQHEDRLPEYEDEYF